MNQGANMAVNSDGIFEVDDTAPEPTRQTKQQPLYQVFEGSRIVVGSAVGKTWKKRLDAAMKAYEEVVNIWDETISYYSNNQTKVQNTPRGLFKRGDTTENLVFSNLNVMLPAVYSKDPDITCSTDDESDKPFCDALAGLLNTLFRRRDKLVAKPKIKRAAAFGLLTNCGVLKLTFTKKDDSREMAVAQMQQITDAMKKAKTDKEVEDLYGQLGALEENMETLEPSGPKLATLIPKNIIIDPYSEMPDGSDAMWMIERVYMPTAGLVARFTQKAKGSGSDANGNEERSLIYKSTHKARFTDGGNRDDGIGLVLDAVSTDIKQTADVDDDRAAYISTYYTECYYVWDKATRRVYLFHKDDWQWPLWVWDDPYGCTRFFPYFIIGFTFSPGGMVSVGETAYYLDQQDEINDINRQVSRIRRTIYDYWFYNADQIDSHEAEKFIEAIRGEKQSQKHALGVKIGDNKIKDLFGTVHPPSMDYEKLFDKKSIVDTINRITNTNDALRGVQFHTNTNVASVESYQESLRLSVGSKVDVIEDVVADIALMLAEMCVQFYTRDEVAGLVGPKMAEAWEQMSVDEFNATYNLTIVAGSMEKPNSVFKKKEAVQIAQAVGQFARAAPGATWTVMLRVLEQAFTEVVIKPEDWEMIRAEIGASLNKGVSAGAGVDGGAGQPGGQQGQPNPQDLRQQAMNLPPQIKAEVVQMYQRKVPPQQIAQFIQQAVAKSGQNPPQGQQPQGGAQNAAPVPQGA
jgi:hypothetical protein